MLDRSRVAIVIPALNEAATIAAVVRAVGTQGQPIVVDDGSTDATASLARQAGAQVVRHAANAGYEAALNSGFAHALAHGFDCIVTVDADGQHDPELIQDFVTALEAGADVVVGARDHVQRVGEHVFAAIARRVWGLRDPLCGMKAYRSEVVQACGAFDTYRSVGTQLCLFAVHKGWRVRELDLRTRERLDAPRFGGGLRPNIRILRAMAIGLARYGVGRNAGDYGRRSRERV